MLNYWNFWWSYVETTRTFMWMCFTNFDTTRSDFSLQWIKRNGYCPGAFAPIEG